MSPDGHVKENFGTGIWIEMYAIGGLAVEKPMNRCIRS